MTIADTKTIVGQLILSAEDAGVFQRTIGTPAAVDGWTFTFDVEPQPERKTEILGDIEWFSWNKARYPSLGQRDTAILRSWWHDHSNTGEPRVGQRVELRQEFQQTCEGSLGPAVLKGLELLDTATLAAFRVEQDETVVRMFSTTARVPGPFVIRVEITP